MSIGLMFFLFIAIYLLLIWKAGKSFPILYLFLFTYFIQYIFSTYLIYNEYDVLRRQMPIREGQYFDYIYMALFFLFAGVFAFNKDIRLDYLLKKIDSTQASRLGYLLLFISYFFDFLVLVGVPGVNSLVSFTSFLKYPAAFCLLFTNSKINYLVIILVYLQLAFIVLRGGVFINFFIWSTYLFFFVCLKFNFSFAFRAGFIVIAIPVLIVVQTVKREYREATWEGQQEAGLGLFRDLAEQQTKKADEPFAQSEGVISTVGRLTQGWHLALTLKRVPQKEPFVNGQEMLDDITSSILPRVIFTEKKVVGSQDKFYKYTGHKLFGSTSMTIGVIGDFYINYGRWGSFVMLFVFGALIAKLLHFFIRKYVVPDPLNLIWVPFILSYLIRANNDFYMVFNCIVKGFLIFLFINYLRKRWWPARSTGKVGKPALARVKTDA